MPYKDKSKKQEYDRKRFQANLDWVRNYKLEQGCKDCGYREHHAGLEFDHIVGKYKNVSAMLSGTLIRLQEEIAKCEVVCGICHNIRTFNRKHGV